MSTETLYSFRFREDFYREPVDKEERALIAIVGERLKYARRDLCKFKISTAADLIGVEPNYLNAIELGFNIDCIPLKMLKKAADVYQVSIDYLMGLNEDWESAPEVRVARDFTSFFLESRIEIFSKAAERRLRQQRRLDKLAGQVNALRLALAEVHEAYDKFTELNPGFNDMLGGATLQNRMNLANEAAISAQMALIKAKVLPKPETLPEV